MHPNSSKPEPLNDAEIDAVAGGVHAHKGDHDKDRDRGDKGDRRDRVDQGDRGDTRDN